jgi:hypothetical protein
MKLINEFMTSFRLRLELGATLEELGALRSIGDKHESLASMTDINEQIQSAQKEYKDLQEFYETWVDEDFEMTITIKSENKDVTFTAISSGEFMVRSGHRWLLCINPNTGHPHFVMMKEDHSNVYVLDEEWMELARVVHIDDDPGWDLSGYEYDIMPCDEDSGSCGVSCFNCSRGN